MKLIYRCPSCGTALGYNGLCWKCKYEQERKTALRWIVRLYPRSISSPKRRVSYEFTKTK